MPSFEKGLQERTKKSIGECLAAGRTSTASRSTSGSLLARLGEALLFASCNGRDAYEAAETSIGWDEFDREVDEARQLIRPDALDPVEVAASGQPTLRQVGHAFVAAFAFGAVPACVSLLRAAAPVAPFMPVA